jgi:hypothetical protein
MNKISLLFLFLIYLIPSSCLGQIPCNYDLNKTCNFENITDSLIKSDLTYFTKKGAKPNSNDKSNFPLTIVDQIQCTDSLIVFENSNIISLKLYVSIYTSKFDTIGHTFKYNQNRLTLIDDRPFWGVKRTIPKNRISRIDVYFSEHKPNAINGYYFNDLYEPRLCKLTNVKNENNSTTCKVFTSKDRRLTYVYIILGDNNVEVTFIFENSQYLMRVIDDIEK